MNELDQYLAELESEGSHESQGWFTIDPVRAQQLLQKLKLPNPLGLGCCLVSFACASNATRIWCDRSDEQYTVRFDGLGLTSEQMQGCSSALLIAARSPDVHRMQQLALAMQAARDLGMDIFEYIPAQMDSQIGVPVHQFRFGYSKPALASTPHWGQKIHATIRQRCQWAQAPIYLDSERIGIASSTVQLVKVQAAEPQSGMHRANAFYTPKGFLMATLRCPAPTSRAALAFVVQDCQLEGSGFFVTEFARYHGGQMLVVHYGIAYSFQWELSDCWAVLYLDQLKLDLGSQKINEQEIEPYLGLAKRLRREAFGHAVAFVKGEKEFQEGAQLEWTMDRDEVQGRLLDLVADPANLLGDAKIFPQKCGPWLSLKDLRRQPPGKPPVRVMFTTSSSEFGIPDEVIVDASHPHVGNALQNLSRTKQIPPLFCRDEEVALENRARLRQWPGLPALKGDFWFRTNVTFMRRDGTGHLPNVEASSVVSIRVQGVIGLKILEQGQQTSKPITKPVPFGAEQSQQKLETAVSGQSEAIEVEMVKPGHPSVRRRLEIPPGMLPGICMCLEDAELTDFELSRILREHYPTLLKEACRIWETPSLKNRIDFRDALISSLKLKGRPDQLVSLKLFQLSPCPTSANPKYSANYLELMHAAVVFATYAETVAQPDCLAVRLDSRLEPLIRKLFPQIQII